MTAKDYLSRAYHIDREIDMLIRERQRAFDRVCSTVGDAAGDRVQTSKKNNQEDWSVAYIDYTRRIDDRTDDLWTVKGEIFDAINRVENNTYRQLLICRYIEFMTWERVAVALDITFQWAHVLHKRALKCMDKIINS